MLKKNLSVLSMVILFGLFAPTGANAQMLTLKTNLLHWATTTPNLGAELTLRPHWSVDLWGAYNLMDFKGDASLRHYLFQAEGRYWLRPVQQGHFGGVHLLGGKFDVGGLPFISGMKEHHYRGGMVGGGLTYGYQWKLNARWAIEAVVGLGFITMNYDKYRCRGCAVMEASYKRNYLGPTRAAVSLVYRLETKPANTVIVMPTVNVVTVQPPLPLRPLPAEAPVQAPAVATADTASRASAAATTPARQMPQTGRGVMYIEYPQNETRVLPHFRQNQHELARIDSILKPLLQDSTVRIRSIKLAGYASPEGKYLHNAELANRRIVEVMYYLSTAYNLPDYSLFGLTAVPEDWEKLTDELRASDRPYKKEALRIINTVPLFDGRELELMKLQRGDPYRDMMQRFFPRLRRTEFLIEWERTAH